MTFFQAAKLCEMWTKHKRQADSWRHYHWGRCQNHMESQTRSQLYWFSWYLILLPRPLAKLQVWLMSQERILLASKRSPWLSVRLKIHIFIINIIAATRNSFFNRHGTNNDHYYCEDNNNYSCSWGYAWLCLHSWANCCITVDYRIKWFSEREYNTIMSNYEENSAFSVCFSMIHVSSS